MRSVPVVDSPPFVTSWPPTTVPQSAHGSDIVHHWVPTTPTWMTDLHNPVSKLIAIGSFVVLTIAFEVLVVFLVLAYDRRRLPHSDATASPSAESSAE
jgi:hypothetical protein